MATIKFWKLRLHFLHFVREHSHRLSPFFKSDISPLKPALLSRTADTVRLVQGWFVLFAHQFGSSEFPGSFKHYFAPINVTMAYFQVHLPQAPGSNFLLLPLRWEGGGLRLAVWYVVPDLASATWPGDGGRPGRNHGEAELVSSPALMLKCPAVSGSTRSSVQTGHGHSSFPHSGQLQSQVRPTHPSWPESQLDYSTPGPEQSRS